MGISNTAKLVFGFEVGGEDEPPAWLGEDQEFSEFLSEKLGIPTNDYKARWTAEAACIVDLDQHCSDSYPMYILTIRACTKTAERGYLTEIDPSSLIVPEEKIAEFKAWCEGYDIPYQEPKWLLCSMNG